jgi:ABC-type nitrate/sulfonate/bicarbonate transport system substrate-binding protein/outer membrane protein OmpA-like peptidoglycan-associated protein
MNKKAITTIVVIILVLVLIVFIYIGFIKGGKVDKSGITVSKTTLYNTKPELFAIKNFSGYKLEKINIDGEQIPILKIPLVTWGGYSALFAANDGIKPSKNSLFYKNGKFVVELIKEEDPNVHLQNFANGTYPVIWSTMDMMPLLYHALRQDKRSRPMVFGLFDWSKGGDAIVVRDRIKTHKDIKGKTIVTSANTPSNFFLLWYLAQLNIKPSEVVIKYTDDAVKAYEAFYQDKSIDVCVTWSPFYQELTNPSSKSYVENSRVLITSRDANQLIADCYIARADFISEHPEIIEAFNKSMMEGYDLLQTNKQIVFKNVATLFKLPGGANDAEAMLSDVHIPNFPENLMFFDFNNSASAFKIFILSQEYYKSDGILPQDVNYDPEYCIYTKSLESLKSKNLFAYQTNSIKDSSTQKGSFDIADLESKNVVLSKDIQIYFDPQKTDFNFNEASNQVKQNKDYLSKIAEQMNIMGTTIVMLIGHLDTTKEEEFKAQGQQVYLEAKAQARLLSKKRAEFIKQLLIEKYNCPADRIMTKGMGWDNPVDPADQTKNRRVEVKFISLE